MHLSPEGLKIFQNCGWTYQMSNYSDRHALVWVDLINLEDLPALSRDVPLGLPSIQAGWSDFE